MKKLLPYIIALIVIAVLIIFLAASNKKRSFNESVTLKKEHTIPYGTYVARKLLPEMFPQADVVVNKKPTDDWWNEMEESSNQAVFILAKNFYAEDDELFDMLRFVRKGNYVFISAQNLSEDAAGFFKVALHTFYSGMEDSLRLKLEVPPFKNTELFQYPGTRFENWVYTIDTNRTTVLGRTDEGVPNFIRLDAGKGSFFVHLAPLAFSNYFLLHKNNVQYYQQALSVIPKNIEQIVWDEYYLNKRRPRKDREDNDPQEPSMLRVLMKEPAFKWGLWTAIIAILVYVLMEMRRKQRFIPFHARPQNDSLDFIKTVGRLYYDRKDHHNLARKMAAYFLEHIRSNYKLPTHTLDEKFIQALHYKSGFGLTELTTIVEFVRYLDTTSSINEEQLSLFYQQLETFYGTT